MQGCLKGDPNENYRANQDCALYHLVLRVVSLALQIDARCELIALFYYSRSPLVDLPYSL